jgi:hypothetical protein
VKGSIEQERDLLAPEECWALLERVADSAQLKRALRMRELLFYIGRRSLKEGCGQVHEQEIGCAVFRRPDTYDTNVDNIVRTSVSDLRKRIEAYFGSEGSNESLVMEIPRGSYVPVFRPVASVPEPVEAVQESAPASDHHRWLVASLVLAGLTILILASLCISFSTQNRADRRLMYPWRYEPSVAALWSGFLDTTQDTDIVLADTSFLLVENIGKQSFTFNDYFNRSYMSQVQSRASNHDMSAILSLVGSKNLGNSSEFKLVQHILALDPIDKKLHIYNAREYTPALTRQDNVILLGSRIANPWDELFEGQLNFAVRPDRADTVAEITTVTNRAPGPGEQAVYLPTDSVGYCVVAYLPNPGQSGKVLLIEGTSSEAVDAAGDFLLSEDKLAKFEKTLHTTKLPYFEVLLKTTQVRSTPLTATVLAYRTYPNLH